MPSKLFRAVVGIGISFGTAAVACAGVVDDTSQPKTGEASTAHPDPGPGPSADPSTITDAAAERDAILDAFCDASWPTTKGNTGGPTCGATEACMDAGPSLYCYKPADPSTGTCEPAASAFPSWCVSGTWVCSTGTVPASQCQCWVGQPCPP